MENSSPCFTIITPSFNSEKTIGATIKSVLNQSFTDFEYLIIDGKSSDKTLQIIEAFVPQFKSRNIQFKYISEKDSGIYDAWNKGIALSNGTWISFLGADDNYFSNALERYYFHLQKHKDCNYISSRIELINRNKKVLTVFGEAFIWQKVVRNMKIAQVGSFHNKQLFNQIGLFNTTYRIVGDLEFYIRCKKSIKPFFFNEVTAQMLNEGASNQIYKSLKEALQARIKHKISSIPILYIDFLLILVKCYINKLINKK